MVITYFPETGKQIAKRYREYLTSKARESRISNFQLMCSIVTELRAEGINPTLRTVIKRIPSGTRIGIVERIELWRDAKAASG
jgi:hypothetical protein